MNKKGNEKCGVPEFSFSCYSAFERIQSGVTRNGARIGEERDAQLWSNSALRKSGGVMSSACLRARERGGGRERQPLKTFINLDSPPTENYLGVLIFLKYFEIYDMNSVRRFHNYLLMQRRQIASLETTVFNH